MWTSPFGFAGPGVRFECSAIVRRNRGVVDVSQPAKLQNCVPLETSLPKGAAPLESILCTEELRNRPSRSPNHEKENSALVALCGALADSPRTILQTLADQVLDAWVRIQPASVC